jgi:hypothetical protein
MDEELESSRNQRTVDRQHLNLLSVFHFVGAGLALLGLGFVFVHFAFMRTVMNSAATWAKDPAAAPPPEFFEMFKWIYLILGGWYGTSLVLNLLAGFYLRAQKHRGFCFVVAGVNCLHIPIGTVLGIFTIIVLARDSVRAAFQVEAQGGGRLE